MTDESIDAVSSTITCYPCFVHLWDPTDSEYYDDYEAVVGNCTER